MLRWVPASTAARYIMRRPPSHLGPDLVGDRVELAAGEPGVQPGDEERGHELQQPEDERHVDVADDLGAHEVTGVGGQDDVQRVPEEERDGHREDEAAQGLAQRGELRRGLDRDIVRSGPAGPCGSTWVLMGAPPAPMKGRRVRCRTVGARGPWRTHVQSGAAVSHAPSGGGRLRRAVAPAPSGDRSAAVERTGYRRSASGACRRSMVSATVAGHPAAGRQRHDRP